MLKLIFNIIIALLAVFGLAYSMLETKLNEGRTMSARRQDIYGALVSMLALGVLTAINNFVW